MSPPTQQELAELGLDDASMSATWDRVIARLRAEGADTDAMIERAAANLSCYRKHPAVWTDADFDAVAEWIMDGGPS